MSDELNDQGIITLMYHRFEENKYPSTNIRLDDFNEQLKLIKQNNFTFVNANNFEEYMTGRKNEKKILLTIDDGFLSFYKNAWPILKKDKIPFILFVNTKEVNSSGYMNWEQVKELAKEDFVHIGNHSYSHGYLVDEPSDEIIKDIKRAISDFKKNLGYNSSFFSYPFGEYSNDFQKIVKELGFRYAFGQHSGVVDETKDLYALPRFPINEKYGDLKRFQTILKTLPFRYKSLTPKEKYINEENNPPKVIIEFFSDVKNIKSMNCYSNENNIWQKSELIFLENNKVKVALKGKFTTERGRINCSLRESSGFWRWLGVQFVVSKL